jgi:hypothetical protein
VITQLARAMQGVNPPPDPEWAAGRGPFALHPEELARTVEEFWFQMQTGALPVRPILQPFGLPPTYLRPGSGEPDGALASGRRQQVGGPLDGRLAPVSHHLIYAYMLENTRIFEVFSRILQEFLNGERLGVIGDPRAHLWARTAETLFYATPPPAHITGLITTLRPDIRASRRNAYWRMFGLPLVHNGPDDRPYPFHRAPVANTTFVETFEELLREVWRGVENASNTSGPNSTDEQALGVLLGRLRAMLLDRREGGTLTREEFVHVTTMSWFHLTILTDSPILIELRALASTPEGRLRMAAERVGVRIPAVAEDFLELAEPMSRVLIAIEQGVFALPGAIPLLYTPFPGNTIRDDLMTIIGRWSMATGRDMKARKVVTSERRASTAVASTRSTVAPSPASNGRARPVPA